MRLPDIFRYTRDLANESIRASWIAANGLFGAVLAGAAMIWRGVLPLVSTDLTSVPNWVLSFVIYASGSWVVLFIATLTLVAPYRLWSTERTGRLKAEAGLVELRTRHDGAPDALSPAQEKLLSIIAAQQRTFATTKLVVGRNGRLVFDGDRSRGKEVDFVMELYGHNDAAHQSEFAALMESMPVEYVRFFPEMRWNSPFVIAVTDRGTRYIRESAKS